MEVLAGSTRLVLVQGDITRQEVDAIVNAANSGLRGGGGVDGAIHRAGGPSIMNEVRAIRDRQGGCPTGQAVITGAGLLKARHVIHAVGPVWHGGTHGEDDLLRGAYLHSLRLATTHGLKTIAFPSISTGVYGFPVDRAARLAFSTVRAYVLETPGLEEARFVVFGDRDREVYERLFQ